MILSWMAYAMLATALCAVAGACVDAALRSRIRQRRAIWVVTMTASVLLPIALPLLSPADPALPTQSMPVAVPVLVPVLSQPGVIAPAATGSAVDWGQFAIIVWIVTSALLSSAVIISSTKLTRRLARYRRSSMDGHAFLVSETFGPAVVGLLHPTIVLPAWALQLSERERHLVMSHELEHQRARDPQITIAALLLVALFPWNIALWWQLARLRLAIEFDCDARVLSKSGADPFAYGNLLLIAHEHSGRHRLAALALAPIRSALGKRVDALVIPGAKSARRTLAAAGVAALALSALGFAPVPRLPLEALETFAPARSTPELSPSVDSQSTAIASTTLRDKAPNVVVPAAKPNVRKARAKVVVDSRAGRISTPAVRSDFLRVAAPDSVIASEGAGGGSFGVISAAVMQRAPGGTVVLSSAVGGGRGGLLTSGPPLKTYTGGFMNAEVPARPDSARPPLR